MLTALDFWHLIEHIIPLYVVVIIAYAVTRLNLITPEHAPGITRWVSFMGVPTYFFHLLAFNDPYQTSFLLVAADVISKALALISSCLWWKFSRSGSIDGVIAFFMLATLPNTVLIGDALLQPLYGDQVHTQVVTIIFMQSLLWYNLCICLYETRYVFLQEEKQAAAINYSNHAMVDDHHVIELNESGPAAMPTSVKSMSNSNVGSNHMVVGEKSSTSGGRTASLRSKEIGDSMQQKSPASLVARACHGEAFLSGSCSSALERTISAPAGFLFSRSRSGSNGSLLSKFKVCDFGFHENDFPGSFIIIESKTRLGTAATETMTAASGDSIDAAAVLSVTSNTEQESQKRRNSSTDESSYDGDEDQQLETNFEKTAGAGKLTRAVGNEPEDQRMKTEVRRSVGGFALWGILGLKMMNRMKRVPLTYASVAGLIYSLFAFKYKWSMPYPIRTSLELISQTAIGMAIFLMGMTWAKSGRLISCGWKALVYGVVVRFLVGPILMIVSAKAASLKGQSFKLAVLQAVIPQGVMSFVLAKEYGVDVPLFNTAIVFQLVIFVPIVLCYYYTLERL